MSLPLVGMDLADLSEAVGPDQPPYRARQLYQAIYRGQTAELVQISTLPAKMRDELSARHRLGLPVRGQRTHTNARTRKGPAKPIAGKKK